MMCPELVVRDSSDGTRMSGPMPTAAPGEDGLSFGMQKGPPCGVLLG
jgi:hypothetical protein